MHRKRSVIETVNDELKNMCQVEHSRHRSFVNSIVNILAGLAACSFFPKKPFIKYETVKTRQLCIFELSNSGYKISVVHIIAGGLRPDVIICEIFDDDSANIGFCEIKKRWLKIEVVVMSVFNIEIFFSQAFLMGCSGCFTRKVVLEELFYGLDRVERAKDIWAWRSPKSYWLRI